jgi:hypothetical protein
LRASIITLNDGPRTAAVELESKPCPEKNSGAVTHSPSVVVPALPGFARKIRFVEADQADLPCPVLLEKIFLFFRNANQLYDLPSQPERGTLRNVINVGWGCGGRGWRW